MADFEDALKKALAGISDDFLAARNDLMEEVLYASQQVYAVTSGRVTLALVQVQEDEDGAVLSLVMGNEQDLHQEITGFKIGPEGYPILSAPSIALKHGMARRATKIDTKEGIKQFFTQLASDRNSPLVRKLAFVLRKT